jgi:hypothetical protein
MRRPRTYETPPGGADAAGLEDYVVELRGGNRIGTVVAMVEESGRRWLVVEQGTPPFKHDRRTIPASQIESVDHDSLVVFLREDTQDAGPTRGLESADAEAVRVTEPADAPTFVPPGDVAGPTDRTGTWFAAFASGALGLLILLGLLIGLTRRSGEHAALWALLAIPAALLLLTGLLAYRLWRNPYARRRT